MRKFIAWDGEGVNGPPDDVEDLVADEQRLLDVARGWDDLVERMGRAGISARLKIDYRHPWTADSMPPPLKGRRLRSGEQSVSTPDWWAQHMGSVPGEGAMPDYADSEFLQEAWRLHDAVVNAGLHFRGLAVVLPERVPTLVHRYVLLMNSVGGALLHPRGLPTHACLGLIWDTAMSHPDHTHVIFAGSYDVNCMLKDLSVAKAQMLQDDTAIKVGPFEVEYRARRALILRRGRKEVVLWDIFGFYQTSFVKSLELNLPDFHGLETIRRMKAARRDFQVEDVEEIARYCALELEALVGLCERLEQDLHTAGIGSLRHLYGAGSVAGAILGAHDVKSHIGSQPEAVTRAAQHAYFGGRVELWRYGLHSAPFHTHDIRSAYPAAMQDLPSLADGGWTRTRDLDGSPHFAVFKVRYDGRHRRTRAHPFPCRLKSGHILFPPQVEVWCWRPELEAARRCGFEFQIMDGWAFEPAQAWRRPFDWIPGVFAERRRLKEAGKMGAQQVLKLGLNSLYGKTAQTIGGEVDRPPAYHQFCWAGWTTSLTRARVFEAAMQDPDAVAFISTDGIGTTRPLRVEEGPEIGSWEVSHYSGCLAVQAGVYFLWDGDGEARTRVDRYRGFDRGTIDPAAIEAAWRAGRDEIPVPSTRFITLGSALRGGDWWGRWRSWRTVERDLHLRGGEGKRECVERGRPWLRMEPLEAAEAPGAEHIRSRPYAIKWLGEEYEEEELDGVPESVVAQETLAGEFAQD